MTEQDAQSKGKEALTPTLGVHHFMLVSPDHCNIAVPVLGWLVLLYLQSFAAMHLSWEQNPSECFFNENQSTAWSWSRFGRVRVNNSKDAGWKSENNKTKHAPQWKRWAGRFSFGFITATPLHFCDHRRQLQIPGVVSQGVMQRGFQGKWIDDVGVDFREASWWRQPHLTQAGSSS